MQLVDNPTWAGQVAMPKSRTVLCWVLAAGEQQVLLLGWRSFEPPQWRRLPPAQIPSELIPVFDRPRGKTRGLESTEHVAPGVDVVMGARLNDDIHGRR